MTAPLAGEQRRERTSLWEELAGHRSWLTVLASRWGMTADDAEDAASDAVVEAATSLDLDRGPLDAALSAAIHRYGIAHVLRADREAFVRGRYLRATRPYDRPVEDEVLGRHYCRALLAAAGLTAQEQKVAALVTAGHRHTDVARRLGLTSKASQRTFDRARHKLRGALARPQF